MDFYIKRNKTIKVNFKFNKIKKFKGFNLKKVKN